jgi:hypothetical protein
MTFLGIVILRVSKFKILVMMKRSRLFGHSFPLEGGGIVNSNLVQYLLVGSQFTFFHCLISCPHQCFENINFSLQFSNKRHFYSLRHLHTYLRFFFTTVSVKTWSFEVALKSLLNCHYPSCRYAHCVYILLITMQLAKLFDLYSLDIL